MQADEGLPAVVVRTAPGAGNRPSGRMIHVTPTVVAIHAISLPPWATRPTQGNIRLGGADVCGRDDPIRRVVFPCPVLVSPHVVSVVALVVMLCGRELRSESHQHQHREDS